MKVELVDRHAEHVDPNVPLCEHNSWNNLGWGDVVKVNVEMDMPGWLITSKIIEAKAEVEVHLISKNHIRIIVNHADYLKVKAVHDAQMETR